MAELERICGPQAIAINAYLVSTSKIKQGETFRNVRPDYAERILKNPAGFLKVVKEGK